MIVDLSLNKYANMTEEQATHAAAQEITTMTIERSGLKREVRSYEVSLWTLQDDFITVLKWSDAEQRGRIQNPLMKLDVDGTQNFTFSIPMYIYVEQLDSQNQHIERLEKQENPIWYNTQNGNLIASMRKIKVIINKGKSKKKVIEFLITKVSESHEQDQMMCNIECEGLAFHELGKIGYKISLNQATFRVDEDDWYGLGHWTKYDGTISTTKPVENVQYWCEKCGLISYPGDNVLLNPKQWYYDIQMNWNSFKTAGNSHIVYENEFVSSWTDELTPNTIISGREKWRIIDVNESNIYNITQTIAETFKIYCRYEYKYDDNYHIIGRKIIFYNNYLNEDNMLSFTYPYDLANVTREMDATDLVTKMYVRPQDNSAVVSGQVSIANCSASKTKEDYLLNFDYLYMIGAITKEQYDEIPVFEKAVRALNKELEALELQINAYQKESIEQSALAEVYHNSMTIDGERIDHNNALYTNLDKSDGDQEGYFTRGPSHPYSTYIKTDKATGRRYIKLSDEDKGVDTSRLMIFRSYNTAKQTFKNRITNYSVEYDAYGFASEITLSGFSDNFTLDTQNTEVNVSNWSTSQDGASDTASSSSSLLVYLVYKYKPVLYYEKINQTWLKKLSQDTTAYNTANAAATAAESNLDSALESQKQKLAEKRILVDRFSRMMGPALREGYWQPEDYTDYGNTFNFDDLSLSTYDAQALLSDTGNNTAIGWDATLFDSEDKLYFEETVLRNQIYYPCIALNSTMLSRIATWVAAGKKPQLIFNNNYYKDLTNDERLQAQNLEMFTLGGALKLGFMHGSSSATIVPILIVTGAEDMTDDQINFMINNGQSKLGIVDIDINETDNTATLSIENDAVSLSAGNFYWYTSKASGVQNIEGYEALYPRIKISSNDLNTTSIVLKYNNNLLQNYTDYEVLSRTSIRNNEGNDEAYFEYFITIKPVTLLSTGGYTSNFDITYVLSNAATSIYLDAQDVMIDSSKPRVSYTVKVNALNTQYLNAGYDDLARIVMINDSDLKFENVFGYISGLKLNLDKPWEDEIEVKNYKTKFEDLFSMIVASSEAMKRSGAAFNAAANGEVPLTENALNSMIGNNISILKAYLDSGFDSSQVVKDRLTELFTEAGEILGCANKSLENIYNLNLKNSSILAGFIENITADLTPKVVTSRTQPTSYKVGDVWNEVDTDGKIIARHVATSSSTDSAQGYTKTFDGTLSSIKGANMEYDAVEGTVDIYGEHNIQLRSGQHVYIGAGDSVDIVGNRAVNIGGATINIAAGDSSDLNGGYTTGGINLVSSNINFKQSNADIETAIAAAINSNDGLLSKVLIHPDKIEMGGANIIMKGAKKILSVSSDGSYNGTSAIQISTTEGIWIGSGNGIRLYSGNVFNYNDTTKEITTNSGANVELTSQHLILGYSTTNNAQVIEMKNDYLVIASGNIINSTNANTLATINTGVTGTSSGLIGAKFTKESIGLATQSGTSPNIIYNAFIMNDKGLTLASSKGNINLATSTTEQLRNHFETTSNGSFVRVAADGIELGSLADLYINTDNFKLQTHSRDKNNVNFEGETIMAIGSNLQGINYETQVINGVFCDKNGNEIKINNQSPQVRLLLNKNGAYINGDVVATRFTLAGASAESDFNTAVGNTNTIGNIVASSKRIYALTKGTTEPISTLPDPPEEIVTLSTSSYDTWALTYPTFPSNIPKWTPSTSYEAGDIVQYENSFYVCDTNNNDANWTSSKWHLGPTYYSRLQIILKDGTVSYVENIKETTISNIAPSAYSAANTSEPFTHDGLSYGLRWGNTDYGVVLSSSSYAKPLLIGSHSGITIAKPSAPGEADGAAIVINSDGIEIASEKFLKVDMTNFKLNGSGDLTVTGEINATKGTIGDIYIYGGGDIKAWLGKAAEGETAEWAKRYASLYGMGYGITEFESDGVTVHYRYPVFWAGGGQSGGAQSAKFTVFENGELHASIASITGEITATSGKIGKFEIKAMDSTETVLGVLASNPITTTHYIAGMGNSSFAFWAGNTTDNRLESKFRVMQDGSVYATSANISGTINANGDSQIGGWKIRNNWLYKGKGDSCICLSGNPNENEAGNNAFWVGADYPEAISQGLKDSGWTENSKFRVTFAGNVYGQTITVNTVTVDTIYAYHYKVWGQNGTDANNNPTYGWIDK